MDGKKKKQLWEVTPLTPSAAEFLGVPVHEPVVVEATDAANALRKVAGKKNIGYRLERAWAFLLPTVYAEVIGPGPRRRDNNAVSVHGRVRIRPLDEEE